MPRKRSCAEEIVNRLREADVLMAQDDAYNPETFRATGHRLIDQLAEYLHRARAGDMPVLPAISPGELLHRVPSDFPREPTDDVVELLTDVVERSNHLHHPRYMGHQVATTLPAAALAEMAGALLNNGMAIYEMGQMQTVMERHVLTFLASTLGFSAQSDGVLTHGGSLGNLTALLAARQAKAGRDVWTEGQRDRFSLLVSDQAHYCVARAVQCMGWGAAGAIQVPTDERFHMRPEAMEPCLKQARDDGREVIAVVASCCSTATGSFDPLPEIADFCKDHDLWLHVDGAHGAALALSSKHRHRLEGVHRADSVVWDLHKMMALPALSTAVLFRKGRRSYEAFAQEASYLFEKGGTQETWYDVGQRTMECTKRGLSVTAYCALRHFGTKFFERHIDRLVGLAAEFSGLLEEQDDFEIAVQPEANILCFRHVGDDIGDCNAHQAMIRKRIVERGTFYIVQATLGDRIWLRVTMMNPATSREDLVALLDEIRTVAT